MVTTNDMGPETPDETPQGTPEEDLARHAAKMAKKKAARDKIMAGKSGEKGLIIVHTGAGKGKSSSGFGMILRCIAHEMPCAVVQFIKGAWDTGERRLIEGHFGDLCQFHAMGEGFTWETQDKTRDIAAARAGWEKAKELIRDLGKEQSHSGNLFIAVVGKDSIGFRIDRKRIETEMGKDWIEDRMEGYTSEARITFAPAPTAQ